MGSEESGPDLEFARLAGEYLDDRAERHPELATSLGDHRFDDRLADPSAAALAGERRALDGWGARLDALDPGGLSAEHRVDAAMMADSVARRVFEIDELAEHTWNPLLANPGRAIYMLLARDFAPLPDRLASVAGGWPRFPARWPRPGGSWAPCPGCTWKPPSGSSTARSRWSASRSTPRSRPSRPAAAGWPRCARPRWRPWPSTGPGCLRGWLRRPRDPTATGIRGSGPSCSPASCRSP